jgi:hypothetical protein
MKKKEVQHHKDQKAIYLCWAEQKSKKKRKKCHGEHNKKEVQNFTHHKRRVYLTKN